MDHHMNHVPYYQGYEIPIPDHRRPYRTPVNQSFRSERDPEREHHRKSEVRRSASFHAGRERTHGDISYPSEEFNRLYSGKIPIFAPSPKRDISFMLDKVKDEVKDREDSNKHSKGSIGSGSSTRQQVLGSVGAGGVQFAVGFFYAATHITLISALVQSPMLTDNVNANLHRIVFLVFSAVASAACGSLLPSARYRKLISSGAILLVFSCLSASLVTSGRFMFLPYGVIAGSAHGILRTVSYVAAADINPVNRLCSVASATMGHALGGILGTFVYFYFMVDYLTSSLWTNNFRILELLAVVALLLGSGVRRPRVTSRRASLALMDPGVHTMGIFYGIAFLALGVMHYLMPLLPGLRGFAFSKFEPFFNPLFALYCGQWVGGFALALTGAACGKASAKAAVFVCGVFVFLLGVAVMPHRPAYDEFWGYMGLCLGQGIVTAFAQTLVAVGVARRTSGLAVGVSISLLMVWQDAGTLFGIVAVDNMTSDFTLNVALYMSGGILLFAGLGFVFGALLIRPLRHYREPFASDKEDSSSDLAQPAGISNPGMGRWGGYEYDYRYMH